MRIVKLFVACAAAAVALCGCTKEEYYGSQMFSRDYVVTPSQWQRNEGANNPGSENYLWADLQNTDITQAVVDGGAVQAFIYNIYDSYNNLGAWNTLPYVYPLEVYENGTDLVIVPENIRFEWERGKVTLIIQDLDGFDPENMVSTINVRVCVTSL